VSSNSATDLRAEIYAHLCKTLVEQFELKPEDLKPEARLYEDLDIDSIDAVDLVVELRQFTGKRINPEDFKSVRTLDDVVDAIERLQR
jgi:acyl carrier protein